MYLVLYLIVLALATWRLSYMLVEEEGPYRMFAVVRDWLGVGSLDEQENPHKNMLKGVFECIYCMSVWVGIFFSILHFSATNVSFYIALPFALSAVVIFLEILHE